MTLPRSQFIQQLFWLSWYALIFIIPFELLQLHVLGISLRLHQLVFVLTCILGGYAFAHHIPRVLRNTLKSIRKPWWYYQHVYIWTLLLIWLFSVIGGIRNGEDLQVTLIRSGVFLGYIGVFWLIYYGLRKKEQVDAIINILIVSTMVVIIIGVYEAIALQWGLPDWTYNVIFDGRADSLFPEPNWFGMWLAIMTAIALPRWYQEYQIHGGLQWGWLIFFFLLIFTNILTLTRASWLATAVVVLLFVFQYLIINGWQYLKQSLVPFVLTRVVIVILVASLLAPVFSPFNLWGRAVSIVTHQITITETVDEEDSDNDGEKEVVRTKVSDVNVSSRILSYQQSLSLIGVYPFLGVGHAGFEEYFEEGSNPSNLFLSVFVSSGVAGGIIFLGLIYIWIKQASIFFVDHPEYANMMLGIIMAIGVVGMFNDPILMGFMWLMFGFLARLPDLIMDEDLNHVTYEDN